MIDHTGVNVSDFSKSKVFYQKALAPLGYKLQAEYSAEQTGDAPVAGYGVTQECDFWIAQSAPQKPHIHAAFRAENRQQVDAFYHAAIGCGGRDNGAPGVRAHYHKDYYAAFVMDPDGHNIEVVCHKPDA